MLEKPVNDKLDAVRRAAHERLPHVAEQVRRHILERTMRGMAVTGRRMAPYAPSTQYRKHTGPHPVTLRDTWLLMSSIEVRRQGKAYTVSPTGFRNLMISRYLYYGNEKTNLPPRQWWGVTLQAARQMRQEFGTYLQLSIPPPFGGGHMKVTVHA